MFKRMAALLLVGALLLSLTGCKTETGEPASSDELVESEPVGERAENETVKEEEPVSDPKEEIPQEKPQEEVKREEKPAEKLPEKEEPKEESQPAPEVPEEQSKEETNPEQEEEEETVLQGGPFYAAEENPYKDSLKILAIGNSFSIDGMEYLWDIANSMGVKKVVLGNMYIGGCSLDTHYENMAENAPAYRYYKNTSGTWKTEEDVAISTALKDEKWDIITLQQVSGENSNSDSYVNLYKILQYIQQRKPQKDTKLAWHMTWAYQSDSNRQALKDYGGDQIKMYQGVLDRVQNDVLIYEDFVGVIPVGTAIQNLRTTPIGDTLTRDGYHLSKGVGRFTAALTWYCYITGADPSEVPFTPLIDTAQILTHYENICKSVSEAIKNPYEIMK